MIALVFLLLTVYSVVYIASRPNTTVLPSTWRILAFSCVLAVAMFVHAFYQSDKPPVVNYYKTGWLWLIEHLNQHYASVGNPNRIPDPGK